MAGVSRAAVGQAVQSGILDLTESRKIDLDSKKTKIYLKRNKTEPKRKQNHTGRIARAKIKKGAEKGESPEQTITRLLDESEELKKTTSEEDAIALDKYQAELKKTLEQTRRLQIATARDLRHVIPIEEVRQLFHKINSIVVSHLHPVGFRTAEKICGMLGITDPEKILSVEKTITDETMIGIEELKTALYIEPEIEEN